MMDVILGQWNLQRSENLPSFLKALGVGVVLRNVAPKLNGSMLIEKLTETQFRIQIANGFKSTDRVIEIGTDFEADGANGSSMVGKWELESEKMVGRFKGENGDVLTIIREVVDGCLVQTMEIKGCTAKRIYHRT